MNKYSVNKFNYLTFNLFDGDDTPKGTWDSVSNLTFHVGSDKKHKVILSISRDETYLGGTPENIVKYLREFADLIEEYYKLK